MNETILKYIAEERARGVTEDAIKIALLEKGWKPEDVHAAFGIQANPTVLDRNAPMPGVFGLFNETWQIFIAHWKFLIYIGALVPFFLSLATILAVLIVIGIFVFLTKDSGGLVAIIIGLGFVIGIVLLICIQAWSYASFYNAFARNIFTGIKETYRSSRRYMWNYVAVTLLCALAMLGGLVLLIIPAFIFAIWFSFANIIIVTEQLSPVQAMKQSRGYVRGRWWRIFWREFAGPIAASLIVFIPFFIIDFFLLPGFAPGTNMSFPLIILNILLIIVRIAVQFGLSAFMLTYFYVLYQHVKRTAIIS